MAGMSTDAKEQEAIMSEMHRMREELREGLRRLDATAPRQPDTNSDAWELAVANQAELSLRQEVVGLRREMQALKERAERFELEARRR
jgi:hypothetical protein